MKSERICRDHFVQPSCLRRVTRSRLPMARWLLISPKMETPQPPWATCASTWSLSQQKEFYDIQTGHVFLVVPIVSSIPLFTSFSPLSSLSVPMYSCDSKVLVHGHPLLGIQLVSLLTALICCLSSYDILINLQKKGLSRFFLCFCST